MSVDEQRGAGAEREATCAELGTGIVTPSDGASVRSLRLESPREQAAVSPGPSTEQSLTSATSGIPIKLLPQLFNLSTRLQNWLSRAQVHGDLPVGTVGEYVEALPGIESTLLRSWGMGRKTVAELSGLVRFIAEAGAKSTNRQDLAAILRASNEVASMLLGSGDSRRDADPTTAAQEQSHEQSLRAAGLGLLSADQFPDCIAGLPMSTRLESAVAHFRRHHRNRPTLAEFLEDEPHWLSVFRDQPNTGRKTLSELSDITRTYVAGRLMGRGLERHWADQVASWLYAPLSTDFTPELRIQVERALDPESGADALGTTAGPSAQHHYGEIVAAVEKEGKDQLLNFIRALLSPKQYEILSRRFGLNDGRVETLEEISHSFHVTRERIRQIEAKALKLCRATSVAQVFEAFLRREKDTIAETILGAGQCVLYQYALAQEAELDPAQRLAIVVCHKELEKWLDAQLQAVSRGRTILGWIAPVVDPAARAMLGEQLQASAQNPMGLRRQILSALFDVGLPATVSQLEKKIVGVPDHQIHECLRAKLGAHVVNGEVSNFVNFPTTWRVRLVLKMARRPLTLKEVAANHLKTFDHPIDEHTAGAALQRLDDTLIVARGTYGLYEHLPFGEELINKVKRLLLDRVRKAGHYVSAKILLREIAREIDSKDAALLSRYMIVGFCHDDNRFSVRRGLMIGLSDPAFERRFVSLYDSVHGVIEKYGRVRVADIKKHLASVRDVLDISIMQALKSAPDVVLADRGIYDLIGRVVGSQAQVDRLSHALQLALIDHDASVPVLMSRLASVGIEYELPTIVSFLGGSEIASEADGVFHLESTDTIVGEYNAVFDRAYAETDDTKAVAEALERAFANDPKRRLIKLDYRLQMDPSTWDNAQSLTQSNADVLRELLSEFEF